MGHGTRYNEGDVVEVDPVTEENEVREGLGADFGKVVSVDNHRSESPDYKVEAIINGRKRSAWLNASDLTKVEDWQLETEILLENRMEVEVKQTPNSFYEDLGATAFEAEGTGVNGESEWIVFRGSTQATRAAEATVERDLEENPLMLFSHDFIKQFMYVGETDKRLTAQDEARHQVNGMDAAGIIEEAGIDESELPEDTSSIEYEAAVENAEEQAEMEIAERIESEIEEDPVEFFGRFYGDLETTWEEAPLRIDMQEAKEAAVKADGTAHFLDRYDGEPVRLENGALAYGIN
jgi:hypothetical protein